MTGEGPRDSGSRLFSYHRSIGPMLWVMVGLSTIELAVVHLLISFWSHTAALILSMLTVASIVWIVLLIRSMRRLPVLLDERRLVMRVGTLRSVEGPLDKVAGLRPAFDAVSLNSRGVENLALLAWPNVFVEFAQPVRQGRRELNAVAHKLDDAAAFTAELTRLLHARQRG